MIKWTMAVLAVSSVLLAGCQPSESKGAPGSAASGKGGDMLQVALLPKQKGVPYFTSCAEGAEEAAKELGDVDVVYNGPTDGSPEAAASMIERWALKGMNVIAVSPNDPNVVGPAMKKAREQGLKVITWDADAAADSREFFVNQATAQEIGYALTDSLAKALGGDAASGKVAIVTATLTAANQNEWIKYIRERLTQYPGLELVAVEPSNENQKLAFTKTQDLMKAHPELKGVFAISSVAFPGAAEAVKQAGKAGQVEVIGLSTPNDMRKYIKEGVVRTVVLWNTKDLGYLTIYVARALAKGELKPGATEFEAGRLGKRKVVGDQVLLGELLEFTKDNIDEYDF